MTAFANTRVTMTVFFLDGTRAQFSYAKQAGSDAATVLATVKKAIDADKLVLEVDGDLLVIPTRSVKYIQVSPAPSHLPSGILRRATVIG